MTNRWISFFVTVETLAMGADRCYEPFWAMDGIRLDSVAWRCVGWSSCLSSVGLHHRSGGVARESSKEVSVSSSTAKEEDGRFGPVRSGPVRSTTPSVARDQRGLRELVLLHLAQMQEAAEQSEMNPFRFAAVVAALVQSFIGDRKKDLDRSCTCLNRYDTIRYDTIPASRAARPR
jgi:hypothetical protein